MPVLPVRPSTQLVAGVVSGVTGTAAGIGGPPLALLYQHRPGSTIRSTLAAAFLVGTALSLATLAVAGEVGASQVLLGLGLAPLVVVGSVTGRRFHEWLDQGRLRSEQHTSELQSLTRISYALFSLKTKKKQ